MSDYILRLRELVGGEELLQVASVSVALRDDHNRVLLARHSEHGKWLLPGGSIEPGEVPADAAIREMREETGLLVRLTRLVGVFGGLTSSLNTSTVTARHMSWWSSRRRRPREPSVLTVSNC